MFTIRAILAATLSPTWGVYSGFELFENAALAAGREEYLDSEKFQFRPRDCNAEPNLNLLIGPLNYIRKAHPALQQLRQLTFHHAGNDAVLAYSKRDGDDVIIVICSLDPARSGRVRRLARLRRIGAGRPFGRALRDELTGAEFTWNERNFVRLSPGTPAHILHVQSAG